MCLVLGATGSGKTLLVKRLENSPDAIKKGPDFSFEDMPATIATVGTNLVSVSVNRRQEITMREIGGCMGPIWKNYFKDATAVMDMPGKLTKGEIETLFRLSDIKSHCDRPLEHIEVSACTGQGIHKVIKWMEQNCFGK